MKTAAIITFINNYNFGSTLQAYALKRAIEDLGWQAYHLNYAPSKLEKLKNLLLSGNSPKLILEGILRRRGWDSEKNLAFDFFQDTYLDKTDPLSSHAQLAKATNRADRLICGSDQIFSPVWLNPAYFGVFTDKPKGAYAPSFGVREIPDAKAKRMKPWLKAFDFLSCREANGAKLIKEITGKDCPVACDPVCLLTGDEWRELAQPFDWPRPYLLCYLLGDREDYPVLVEQYAREKGLEPLIIPVTTDSRLWNCQRLDGLGPQEFLSAVAGADYILTDSFHMTAFAALLERPCTPLRREPKGSAESKHGRIKHFLRTTGLDPENPDWETVRPNLEKMRQEGLRLLKKALGEK